MALSMAFFAVADVFIKLASTTMPNAQTTLWLMGGGGIIFAIMALRQGEVLRDHNAFKPILLLRYAAEIIGTFSIVIALSQAPLSTVGAIIQATPLAVTMGAVLFLGEQVSARQWIAIAIGFAGVLLIIQPGTDGFQISTLWAVASMLGLSGRDLTTKRTPPDMASSKLATYTMAAAVPFAVLWCLKVEGTVMPSDPNWGYVAAMIGAGAAGYLLLIASIRTTDVSVVAPFRYTRLLFLLLLGVMLFDERPSALVLLGAALVVGSGVYTTWLSRR